MFCDVQNSKIGLPLVKPIQRIVIGAEVFRQSGTADRLLEHPADRKPSTTPRWIPNPMIRRVYWSMTTRTQYVCRPIDSHWNKSRSLHHHAMKIQEYRWPERDGRNAMASRRLLFGLIQSEQKPAIRRSRMRRFGARLRERLRINN